MSTQTGETPGTQHAEAVRRAFEAALRGDFETVRELLADDVRWYAAGYEGSGCQNREQALAWMEAAVGRGRSADVLDVRAVDEERVIVLLQRKDGEAPHGQIVRFRGDEVAEIVVYPSDEEAVRAASAS